MKYDNNSLVPNFQEEQPIETSDGLCDVRNTFSDGNVSDETVLYQLEPRIKLYWHMIDDKLGFMERIALPTGGEILFDHKKGCSDFEPLKEHIGVVADYYRDGVYEWSARIEKIAPNEDGVNSIYFGQDERPVRYDDVQMNNTEEGA